MLAHYQYVGLLPALGEIEHAIETPEGPPSLIGRYSSGGANYMIFADGSIEAETQEGALASPPSFPERRPARRASAARGCKEGRRPRRPSSVPSALPNSERCRLR